MNSPPAAVWLRALARALEDLGVFSPYWNL